MTSGDGTSEGLQRHVALTLTSNLIGSSTLTPLLGTNEVEPTITLAPELTATLVENVVDSDGSRCGGNHSIAIINRNSHVIVHREGLLTSTCTQFVDEVTSVHRATGTLNGSLSGNEEELRVLSDIERTGVTTVHLRAETTIVVSTVDAELPVDGVLLTADVVDTNNEVSTASHLTKVEATAISGCIRNISVLTLRNPAHEHLIGLNLRTIGIYTKVLTKTW